VQVVSGFGSRGLGGGATPFFWSMSIIDAKNALSLTIMQGQRVFDAMGSPWRLFHGADFVFDPISTILGETQTIEVY
jgi:hypothetical protein